jgi:hypothetical protein
MSKRYLFLLLLLFPLTTMFKSGGACAQTDAEYNAALAAIVDGGSYYITTEVDDIKYFLDAGGYLTSEKKDAGIFLFKKIDGSFKSYGFYLDGGAGNYFTNPASSANINDTKINTHTIAGCRNTWDAQVFFLNENGKYAVRATNAPSASSGWGWVGNSYWAVKEGPIAGYSFDVNYIWELEFPSDLNQILAILNSIVVDYENQVWDDEEGASMNIGTGFGQLSDKETWLKFWNLLQVVYQTAQKASAEDYDINADPDAPTLEWANTTKAAADSMYQKILDSEVPYSLPNGDGYYRIISRLRYSSNDSQSGYVDKAFAASISSEHANKGVYTTIDKDRANFLWKLTQHGDSIEIQNAGMETYISFSSPDVNRVVMTDAENDRSHVTFDYAGSDFITEIDDVEKDIFYIRLSGRPRGGSNYFHQLGHSSKTDLETMTGNAGTDSGQEMELSFWAATFDKTTDKGTSEWYLEYVPTEEAQQLIEAFAYIRDHDVLVEKNNALRAKVSEALLVAKDSIRTKLITEASQMTSPYSYNELTGGHDGGNLSDGVLIDGDKSTYWHSSYSTVPDDDLHYIQLSGMKDMVGKCELYLCQRAATNDHPKEFSVVGSNDPETAREEWAEMAVISIPNVLSGEENTIPFEIETPYEYVRLVCTQQAPSNRTFWHAAELQISTVKANPNSQYAALGEVAVTLDRIYAENIAVADADVTPEMYEALFNAYEAFLKAMVDPTELRDAMATYADFTKRVAEGTNPGQWLNTDIADAFDALYKEVLDYDEAGRYSVVQNHKYAVMLKAMSKSVMEKANGVKTNKWYRIMFPTEEMFDAYGFIKDGGDKCGDLTPEDQQTMWGTFVSTAKLESEEVKVEDEGGNEVTKTNKWIEAIGGEDLRDWSRLFFVNDDAIEDKDASMFRFVELESDDADYTLLLQDTKDNMSMALDMSTTYTKGEALITDASQFTSNASYPGNDGQKLESGCLIDNNLSTYWHSDYSRTYCAVPYLQVALNQPVSGLIQVYVGRRQGAASGHVVRMYVQGSNDAENWTRVGYIELPFIDAATPVTSLPIDLNGSFSHLRFTMTNRCGSDGGSNIEFDPFAENLTADDYNTKFTYFHASEFQIYPVTADKELSASGKELQQAYTTANKVVLKDATAEDFSAAAKAYKGYQGEFNNTVGKAVLPEGSDKAPATYALQNKATGLFVFVDGTGNQNNIYLRIIPTLVGYKAIGYQRSLLSARTVNGLSCNYLHAGESNRRFCTWGSTDPNSNSGLVVCEADVEYEAPAEFTYYKNVKPGRICDWCNSVTVTSVDAPVQAVAYTAVGQYTVGEDEDAETYLALKAIQTIPAGEPTLFIYGDLESYDEEDDLAETVKFTINGNEKPIVEGKEVNGLIGTLATSTFDNLYIYFNANYAASPAEGQTVTVTPGSAVLALEKCPKVDPDGDYDFSILLGQAAADVETGVKDVSTVIQKISMPGAVYSLDGKLLRTGATLNSLKALGKGIYILNGVRVMVK